MFQKARTFMQQVGAQFIVSGEVVGQRPMSQKRGDLHTIAHHSDLDGLLLRPLSAKLLPPTIPETTGLVDREKLYDFSGRQRVGLIALAHQLGLKSIPTPSTGCALTERQFSLKVHDLIQLEPHKGRWDFELLKTGRHFRFDPQTKVIVGRSEVDNDTLRYMHRLPEATSSVLLEPENFNGPLVLVVGPESEEAIAYAVGMITRYSKCEEFAEPRILVATRATTYRAPPCSSPAAEAAKTLATV
jgi:tRNA U34 2-thiouridine synthase MnmA/TrmU